MKTIEILEIEAELYFPLNSKRIGFIKSGYIPNFTLNDNDINQFGGKITFKGRDELNKGEKAIATIRFITKAFFEQLKIGVEYSFWEGRSFIGTAKVIAIEPIRKETWQSNS